MSWPSARWAPRVALSALREELVGFERLQVARALDGGETLAGIAKALGISAYARAVFEQSLREAVARGDGYIGVDHLLLATLADPHRGASRTLRALGADLDEVRSQLTTVP